MMMIAQLRENRRKQFDYPINKKALEVIHKEKNIQKATCYWLGFLKGVIASDSVVEAELESLVIHSRELLGFLHDDDAEELLTELELSWPDIENEADGLIENILDIRIKELNLNESYNSTNYFYGFLKGIACDNTVSINELNVLVELIEEHSNLLADPRIFGIHKKTLISLKDNVIDQDESDEICEWISRLVGDSFADTGLTNSSDGGLQQEILNDISFEDLKGSSVAITGTFKDYSRIEIKKQLETMNVMLCNSVSKKVDYLIVSDEASKHWATTNAGTKILKAHKLKSKHGKPNFIDERSLLSLLTGQNY